jgi:hypothetical protein
MAKNMYSLMLMDEVVSQIDKIATEAGTNRSNLINEILADYVSFITPQKHIQNIFESISAIINDVQALTVQNMEANSIICIKSALCYKYRPTIRYSVELFSDDKSLGELRVTFRTQSAELLMEITHFLKLWMQLEEHYISKFDFNNSISYALEQGRFKRTLMYPKNSSLHNRDELSKAIADYIQMLDEILKGYLNGEYNSDADIEYRYLNYLQSGLAVI